MAIVSDPSTWDFGVPPGDILEEELEAREITVEEFSATIGRSVEAIQGILDGTTLLDEAWAIDLHRGLGIKVYMWLGLERLYRNYLARKAAQ